MSLTGLSKQNDCLHDLKPKQQASIPTLYLPILATMLGHKVLSNRQGLQSVTHAAGRPSERCFHWPGCKSHMVPLPNASQLLFLADDDHSHGVNWRRSWILFVRLTPMHSRSEVESAKVAADISIVKKYTKKCSFAVVTTREAGEDVKQDHKLHHKNSWFSANKLESLLAEFQGVGRAFYGQVIWLTCMRSSYGDPLIWAICIRCRNLLATSRGRLRVTKPTLCLWRIHGALEICYWRKPSTS